MLIGQKIICLYHGNTSLVAVTFLICVHVSFFLLVTHVSGEVLWMGTHI